MSKQVNYNENLCAGAAIRDDKGRRISKLFEASHPKMTVGYAKNLIMPDTPTEQEFNFRQSGGGVIEDGVALIDKVKGNSVVWNQMIPMKASGTTETANGVTITYTDNGFRLQGTATKAFRFTGLGTCNLKEGHKYLTFGGSSGTSLQIEQWGGSPTDSRKGQPAIVTISETPTDFGRINIYCLGEEIFVGEELHWQFCDLTQMFGAGNEPATYEEFLSRKPKVADEYAYNEGTIVNNKVEKVVTTGRNLWDEEWELGAFNNVGEEVPNSEVIRTRNFVRIDSSKSCFVKAPYTLVLFYYDENKNFISTEESKNNTLNIPANACYLRFRTASYYGTTYNHDICINLSDPAINGKYFPYEKHELDLSWVKEIKDGEGVKLFEDGMRSAGTAFDEVGKNKVVKRVGSVDLGTLPWNTSWWDGDGRLYVNLENKKVGYTNIMYPLGATYYGDNQLKNVVGICGHINNYFIYIGDAKTHSSASEFISSLSGVYAYFELAEPIEVEYDEKNLTYPVVAGGTEEAIASEPSTAFRADIGYGIDAVKTILDLKARVEALEAK